MDAGTASSLTEYEILNRLKKAIIATDTTAVRDACEEVVTARISPSLAIDEAMVQGMRIVGEKFQAGEYFLTDLIVAGEAMEEGLRVLGAHLNKSGAKIGTLILGTVEGDLHSIGKDLVKMLLKAAGFEVIDLGEDVPEVKFVEALRVHEPKIIGMSALITPVMPEMGKVVGKLEDAGLRSRVRVIVGGAPLSKEYAERIGADGYARDAVAGVNMCKDWLRAGDLE